MGSSDAHVALTIDTRKSTLGCEIYMNKNKGLFNFFARATGGIEKEVGEKIEWVDAAVASRIKIRKEVASVFAPSETANHFRVALPKSYLIPERFQEVFQGIQETTRSRNAPAS